MSFEERMDRLTERHEALTQTVELLAAMQTENERRAAERSADLDKRFAESDRRLGQVLQAITRLGNIAEAHEQRLDHLEDRPH
ncbi:MAG TPA: hypothetical protein VHY84_28445 [Bryobacteraceae bacterium]|jgi:chromosome segregation ATPase|nr:hypothetical protein [Bryobacteraceae bacterium]